MEIFGLKSNKRRFTWLRAAVFMVFISLIPGFGFSQNDEVGLDVQLLDGGSSIDFGSLKSLDPSGEPVVDSSIVQVRLTVTTQLNRPYVITQTLNSDIVNQDGAALPDGTIRYRVQIEQGGGLVTVTDLAPLRQETQEIYLSDEMGQPASLLIIYELILPKGQSAGRYFNAINYQVNVR